MGRGRQRPQAIRLWTLLAILLGLLAMHGVASTHHAAAAGTLHATDTPLAAPPAAEHRNGHHHPAVVAAGDGALAGQLQVSPPSPVCDDSCPGSLAMLCVAILASSAAIGLLLRRRQAPHCSRHVLPPPPSRPSAGAREPPDLDVVAELCISRT